MTLVRRITGGASRAAELYHRLVLVVGPQQSGKTRALREVSDQQEWTLINLNLELSEKLLEISKRRRATVVADFVRDIVRSRNASEIVVDNIELLFDPELAVDPLALLQNLSRNQTVIAAWPGEFDGSTLTYATQGHPEARKYNNPDAIIIETGSQHENAAVQEHA